MFSLKEIQSTRTRRPTAGSSYPYVEITVGDLLAQGITQLQLEQVEDTGGGDTHTRMGGRPTAGTRPPTACPPTSAGPGAVPRGGRARGEAAGRPGEEADAAAQRDHPALSRHGPRRGGHGGHRGRGTCRERGVQHSPQPLAPRGPARGLYTPSAQPGLRGFVLRRGRVADPPASVSPITVPQFPHPSASISPIPVPQFPPCQCLSFPQPSASISPSPSLSFPPPHPSISPIPVPPYPPTPMPQFPHSSASISPS